MLFSLTGFRQLLLAGMLVAVLFFLLHPDRVSAIWRRFVRWFCGLILVAGLTDRFAGTYVFTSFVRRLIIAPGLLTVFYIDYFSHHATVWLAQSVLSPVIDYPYDVSVPLLIGREYFGRSGISANANMFADGFANFGYSGLILFTALAALLFWIFSTVSVLMSIFGSQRQ